MIYGEKLVQAAQEEAERRTQDFKVICEMDEIQFSSVIASLQLALRHPKFPHSPTGKFIRGYVNDLIEMCPENRPALKAVLKAGDDTKFDTNS